MTSIFGISRVFETRARYGIIKIVQYAQDSLRECWGILTTDFGGDSGGVTPVPIPNTEVKPSSADGTWDGSPWESRSLPDFLNKALWLFLAKQRQGFGHFWRHS